MTLSRTQMMENLEWWLNQASSPAPEHKLGAVLEMVRVSGANAERTPPRRV